MYTYDNVSKLNKYVRSVLIPLLHDGNIKIPEVKNLKLALYRVKLLKYSSNLVAVSIPFCLFSIFAKK